MSGPEFFDPFGHGKMDDDKKPMTPDGKVFSIHGHPVSHTVGDEESIDMRDDVAGFIDEIRESVGEPTRAIVIVDGPDTGMHVRYVGDMDLGTVVGTLQIAAFVVMHECQDDDG